MTRTTTDPPRISKAQLFHQLGYIPHAGQLLVHRSQAPRRVLAAGSRLGKTTAAAHEVVAAMLQPAERSVGWCVAPTYDLADRVFSMVVEIVRKHLKHRIRDIGTREQRIVLTNLGGGVSEARAKSADRPTSLLGEGLSWLVVDEAAQLKREIWDNCLSQRLLDKKGWALLISTPKGSGWFHKMYRRGQGGRDADYESWAMPSVTNPHLDPAAIEGERARLPAEVFAQEYEAQFINDYLDPCEACGGPSKEAMGTLVMTGDSEPPRCPECDLVVHEDGRTAVSRWPDGSLHFQIIREIGIDWPFGAPDELIPPAVLAADEAARIGPSTKPVFQLTPQEIEWAKAGVPVADWPRG